MPTYESKERERKREGEKEMKKAPLSEI